MTPRIIPKHPSAFSLIEVLFTVVLLSVVLFGVIRLEISQFRLTETQRNEIQAYSLAHQHMEELIALGKGALDATCGSEECQCEMNEGNISCNEEAQQTDGIFTHYFLVSSVGLTNAGQVASVVEWEDGTGVHSGANGGGAVVRRIVY